MKETVGIEDFASRQLNETRYASLLAMRYIGLLFGAGADGIDSEGRRRVQAGRDKSPLILEIHWTSTTFSATAEGKNGQTIATTPWTPSA